MSELNRPHKLLAQCRKIVAKQKAEAKAKRDAERQAAGQPVNQLLASGQKRLKVGAALKPVRQPFESANPRVDPSYRKFHGCWNCRHRYQGYVGYPVLLCLHGVTDPPPDARGFENGLWRDTTAETNQFIKARAVHPAARCRLHEPGHPAIGFLDE